MQIQKSQKQRQESSLKQLFVKISKLAFYTIIPISIVFISIHFFTFSQTEEGENKQYNEEFKNNYSIFAVDVPKNLDFASEKIPLNNYDVLETIDREFLVNTYWQSQTILFLKRANKYFPIIEPILKKNNVPDDFKYLAVAESGLTNAVSPSGAKGFWQFLKKTGKEYNLEINKEVDERYNLEKSTQAACDFFNKSYKKFGNWTLVAASYNMGMNGLNKQLKRQYTNNYWDLLLNSETSRYVNRIVAIKTILNNPDKFGFHVRKKDLYPIIETTSIEIDSTVNDFGLFAFEHGMNYKILKMLNPWLRNNKLTNKSRKKYTILVPKENNRDFYIPDSLKTNSDTIKFNKN